MIYLDNAASAVPFPEAAEEYARVMQSCYGNPGALHDGGSEARAVLQRSRKKIAALLDVRPEEVFFTSGATEANNWAVKCGCPGNRRHILVSAAEHVSVLRAAEAMERQGYTVTKIRPDGDGLLRPEAVAEALRGDTGLLCVQAVNNETGVAQDVDALAALARRNGTRLLCDGVQSFGHCSQNLKKADFISLSAHKLGGPRGVGALVIRYPHHLQPLIDGGGQEMGSRSGTENTPGIAAFALAAELAVEMREPEAERLRALREEFENALKEAVPGLSIHGEKAPRHPGILNCRFPGIGAEEMVTKLNLRGIRVSPGSACSACRGKPSHVLLAMGLTEKEASESVRFSLGRLTTRQELEETTAAVREICRNRR